MFRSGANQRVNIILKRLFCASALLFILDCVNVVVVFAGDYIVVLRSDLSVTNITHQMNQLWQPAGFLFSIPS
jgi:hypothetical protein